MLRHRPAPDSLQPPCAVCPRVPDLVVRRGESIMDRREVLRWLPAGAVLGGSLAGGLESAGAGQEPARDRPAAGRGMPPVKIKDVKVILTAPNRIRLVVVKVTTSEPGLYGLGCATFTQRAYAVATAVEKYL